ncbi:MAG: hypothetical protein ACP5I8_00805 [Phycisphaerae bacterium]
MNRRVKLSGLLLLTGLCASCTSQMAMRSSTTNSKPNTASSRPARLARVDLFSRGVGVFQYQGTVDGTQKETLSFRSGQINDVLASLVFQDTGGGNAGEVTFPAATPLSVTLRGFLLDINNNPSRRELLQQLRGVSVTLALKRPEHCKVTGRIIDLLHRGFYMPPLQPGSPVVRYNNGPAIMAGSGWYMNLLSDGKIKQVALNNVRDIRINNRRLQASLNKALDALANQPDKHKRRMTLWFQGHATRLVRFAYLLETPLWRMTYRLILPAPATDIAGATPSTMHSKPVLQGMVIVANQTDMNWNHVQLDIRGGEPLSFIEDLYRPLYMWRPVAPTPADTYVTPQTYGQGVMPRPYAHKAMVPQAQMFSGAGGGGEFNALNAAQARMAIPMMARQRQASEPFNPLQGVNAMASAGVVHPAFDYHVNNVTVPREQSAMVPVLVTAIQAQQLDLYTIGQASVHAFFAARITNDTHKFLPPGTLTVYTGSIYDGEFKINALPQGQHHVCTFAVDQSTTVRFKKSSQHTALETAALHNATLQLKNQITINTFYAVHNTAARQRTILVRSSIDKQWKILLPATGVTRHKGLYEYTLALQPGSRMVLHIRQRQSQNQNVYLAGLNIAALRSTLKTKNIPTNISTAINKAIALLKIVNGRQATLNRIKDKIQQAQNDEARLRQNLQAMKKVSPVYDKIATELATLDTHLMALQHQAQSRQREVTDAQRAVNTYWSHTNVPQTKAK